MVMFVSKDTFEFFCNTWGAEYPYCELKKTRNRYYIKWVILCGSKSSIPRQRTPLEAVLSSSFDKDTLQHLLLSKQAMPLTPSMSDIMDWMSSWGRSKSNTWYEDVVELFMFYCQEKIPVSDKRLVEDVISLKVKEQCHRAFAVGETIFIANTDHR